MGLVENIKRIAAERNLTITALEKAAGLSDNGLYKWVNHKPSIDAVRRVANVLHVTVDELLSE